MSADRPVGRRYSHVYGDPGSPVYESKRLQARAGAFIKAKVGQDGPAILEALNMELGANLRYQYYGFTIDEYLRKVMTADFLEAVTVIAKAYRGLEIYAGRRAEKSNAWISFVKRAMAEENSQFELDDEGGVHPRIDEEFTAARVSALKGLGNPRYHAARGHFEAAHAALDELPSATNRAVREIFMANEEVFKLAVPNAKRLEGGEVTSKLNPMIQRLLAGAELDAAMGMTRAVVDYITASHLYRHAQGEPEQPPVSMETATFMIGTGTALLRWLIWLDGRGHAAPDPTGGTAAGTKVPQ